MNKMMKKVIQVLILIIVQSIIDNPINSLFNLMIQKRKKIRNLNFLMIYLRKNKQRKIKDLNILMINLRKKKRIYNLISVQKSRKIKSYKNTKLTKETTASKMLIKNNKMPKFRMKFKKKKKMLQKKSYYNRLFYNQSKNNKLSQNSN